MTDQPAAPPAYSHPMRVADLATRRETVFDLRPTPDETAAIAEALELQGLRKVRLAGALRPLGKSDWELTAELGATAVQSCVVTLAPVTTRIDEEVRRTYVAGLQMPEADEAEMPEDDETEPLGPVIDLGAVLVESLSLALPDFPRADGAELGETVLTEPGKAPMRDEDARPFAGLAGLREALGKSDDEGGED